jgi:hypothetical protein
MYLCAAIYYINLNKKKALHVGELKDSGIALILPEF